jgi:hypothetical protein
MAESCHGFLIQNPGINRDELYQKNPSLRALHF